MSDFSIVSRNFIRDLKKYGRGLPVLFLAFILYFVAIGLFNWLSGMLGGNIFFGFIRWFLYLVCMTHFAGLMRQLFYTERLGLSDLPSYDSGLLPPLSQLTFLFWMVDLVLGILPISFRFSPIYFILYGLWEIYRAPAYEVMYIGENPLSDIFSVINRTWKDAPLSMGSFFIVFLCVKFLMEKLLPQAFLSLGLLSFFVMILIPTLYTLYFYSKAVLLRILLSSNKKGRAFKEKADYGI